MKLPQVEARSRAREQAGGGRRPARTVRWQILLLEDADTRLCLVTTHFGGTTPANVNQLIRQSLAEKTGLPPSHVWIFTSHNHSSVNFAENPVAIYDAPPKAIRRPNCWRSAASSWKNCCATPSGYVSVSSR